MNPRRDCMREELPYMNLGPNYINGTFPYMNLGPVYMNGLHPHMN